MNTIIMHMSRSLRPPVGRRIRSIHRALAAVCLAVGALAAPAAAQWTRIPDVPTSDVFSVWANGDTIVAGADVAVYVSTDAGVTWRRSANVAPGVNTINGVWVRNGRLYAGTFGQGVHVSDDLGTTWRAFNQGLVGGFANAQLNISYLLVRGDSLYAATESGAWVCNLATGTWSHFGTAFEVDQAPQILGIAANDTRLVAAAGFNGQAFTRDRGDADWTHWWLNNIVQQPGLAPLSVVWSGRGWVMGTNIGVFVSASGDAPWTHTGPDLGLAFFLPIVVRGHELFAAFGIGLTSVLEFSADDGATWQHLETRTNTGVYRLAVHGNDLYAGQTDGLWRRSLDTVAVPEGGAPARLRFAIAGSQPIGDEVRFRFELPASGPAAIEVFDIAGRRAGDAVRGSWPAGPHEIAWDARGLSPGVYLARLTSGSGRVVARMIHAR
jgi:photosystem II stability/assembly factor-like uncharacterized protein